MRDVYHDVYTELLLPMCSRTVVVYTYRLPVVYTYIMPLLLFLFFRPSVVRSSEVRYNIRYHSDEPHLFTPGRRARNENERLLQQQQQQQVAGSCPVVALTRNPTKCYYNIFPDRSTPSRVYNNIIYIYICVYVAYCIMKT